MHSICFKKEKRFQPLSCSQGWECACVPAPWVHTSWVWQVQASHQPQQFLNLTINFFLTSPASPQSQPRHFCDVLSIYSLKFQKRCRACRWSRGGCWSHWHWDGMWWQSLGLRWWVMAINGIEMARTPSIVKGNKSLKISHLVWFKWRSQWWGILKHFPQSRCILISHWLREK